jgi:Phosphotransferase enzyme family
MNGLRSLDWRLLLPTPPSGRFERLALIGTDEPAVAAARAAGVAADVVTRLDAGTRVDAIVCLRPASIPLEAAAAALAPGGVLYLEAERGRGVRAAADATLAQLPRLGLHVVGRYWPHPRFDEPEVYLPLDLPAAVEWYFRNVFVITTLRARLLARPTQLAARVLGRRLAGAVPRVCLVLSATKPTVAPGPLSADGIPESIRRADVRPLVLMNGGWWSRIVVLPFAPGSREPLAAVKLWRTEGDAGRVELEHRGQRTVRGLLPPLLRDAVPEPLAVADWAGRVVAVERSAEGEWLVARRARRRRLSAHLRELELVSEWLIEFARHAEIARRAWADGDTDTWITRPLESYRQAFDLTEQEQRLAAAVVQRTDELVGTTIPFVWCHNDFSRLNIYCAAHGIDVVDWEGLGPGLPATDLLYYLPNWFFGARRVATREQTFPAFAELFLEGGDGDPAVAAARSALRTYAAALRLDDRLPPVLLVGEWVRRAVGRHDRMFQDGSPPTAAARSANRYVRYVSILASRTDLLFAQPYHWGSP